MQFDPFGEPGAAPLQGALSGSRSLQTAGVGVFWGLVIAIVAMRAAYFDDGMADRLRFVASLARSVLSALV